MRDSFDPYDRGEEQFEALVEAMAHPFRSKLLFALDDHPDGLTAGQLASATREPARKVRYHLEVLLRCDLVAVSDQSRRRGTVERTFRLETVPALSEKDMAKLSPGQLRTIAVRINRYTMEQAGQALLAGTFWRPGFMHARQLGPVDRQGWEELGAIQRRALKEVEAALQGSRKRLESSAEEQVQAVSALLLFELP